MPDVDPTVNSEAREVRRLEVLTGAPGRRRWSAEAKARVVAASLAPGVVVPEVARRHEPRPQRLFAWRHQAKQGRLALPAEALTFVPVIAAPEAPSPTASARKASVGIDVGVVRGASPETLHDQQAVPVDRRRERHARGAELYPGAGDRIQHPRRHPRDHAGRRLDDLTGSAALAVLPTGATPGGRMPRVVGDDFRPEWAE